ncbi:tyrosine-type recombinase/integrase [Polynucleobacter paneuropaeus]|jgi:integrase|uniref:tyrosine-type recombinase/integrase n=1 Tax=Polynucleobacter sp. QLW-P1DATA-2 TaxID=1743167 RepID=UPI0008F80F2A|nr:tyrosine-type recombinase/integrase [Polynucleobacter sp. QLW-P1DATA-2]MBT8534931.1 tyrosine-type recombinase/integrase [Polynucleobacter paneuropaeus]OIN00248.1 integrase [Polynucleobacter sp. QLW-P1DATA-2]
MPTKKIKFNENEIAIFEDAVIYKRGEYWQFRIWLTKERKYARFSLKTTSKSTALDLAKRHYHELMANQLAGKSYYSITAKAGVELYLEWKKKQIGNKIKEGRFGTINTHLEHWLNYIGRNTKLKEYAITDGDEYYYERTKSREKGASQTTIENEQSTINAMVKWLHSRDLTNIRSIEFPKLRGIDKGKESNRRSLFEDKEILAIDKVLIEYIKEAEENLSQPANLTKALCGYFLGIAMITGLRRGEQLQLTWNDVYEMEVKESRERRIDLVKITVRGETSKVGNTRKFVVKDYGYFNALLALQARKLEGKVKESERRDLLLNELLFTANGKTAITPRAILFHFEKVLLRAGIKNVKSRNIVPYSFRHTFITKRVNSGLPIASVAEMCGTSITQIEKTYYHTTEAKMISNALADYEYKDGILVPK